MVLLVMVGVLGAGCEVRTEIGIDVQSDGSGTISVGVGLDAESIEANPGLAEILRVDDLTSAGWTVSGPTPEADGLTWFRVRHEFESIEEANRLLDQISGDTGPFRQFRLDRDRAFAETTTRFDGTVDFTGGLEAFSDAAVAAQLDGLPLGEQIEALEQRIGQRLDETFRFRIAVRLPGDVDSNAPTQLSNGAVWEPRLSEAGPIELTATGEQRRTSTWVLVGIAVLAGFALLLVLLIAVANRRRGSRPTPPSPSSSLS